MDIERVNENTVKFYITYSDIEARGYDKDEIWYDREKGEELFWDMLDEINLEEDFFEDGPLWIQVHALESRIEVTVTKVQMSEDGTKFDFSALQDSDIEIDEQLEEILDQHFNVRITEAEEKIKQKEVGFTIRFKDFEDVISLAHRTDVSTVFNSLYTFEERYYLYIEFKDDEHSEDEMDELLSIILEYGEESAVTVHRMEEYGKLVAKENALYTMSKYFPLR